MYYYKLKCIKMCKGVIQNAQYSKGGLRKKKVCKKRVTEFQSEMGKLKSEVLPLVEAVEREYGKTYVVFIEDYFYNNRSITSLTGKYGLLNPDSIRRDIERLSRKM